MKKEKVQVDLIKDAVIKRKATLIENTKEGFQLAQNVKGHGWAEIIENVPYNGGFK
jgi:hypothetical protein